MRRLPSWFISVHCLFVIVDTDVSFVIPSSRSNHDDSPVRSSSDLLFDRCACICCCCKYYRRYNIKNLLVKDPEKAHYSTWKGMGFVVTQLINLFTLITEVNLGWQIYVGSQSFTSDQEDMRI